MPLNPTNTELSQATMDDEKGLANQLTENIGQAPNAVMVEVTAEAVFSGYEVGFLKLSLIYLG